MSKKWSALSKEKKYWLTGWKDKMCYCGQPAVGNFGGPECARCRKLRMRSLQEAKDVDAIERARLRRKSYTFSESVQCLGGELDLLH
jgi:hypothetical protein